MKREPVASEREPEKWLERLLRRRSAAPPAAVASGACLDADTLAAWADGALHAKELAAAEIHASNCSRCMAMLATIERTGPAVAAPSQSRGLLFRWLVPLTAAATAVAIWMAIPEQQVTPVAREAASSLAPATPPAALPPAEPPQPQALPQQAPSARVDSLSAQARDEAQEARKERAAAPEPSAAPAPPASVDVFSDTVTTARRMALNNVAIIEGISPDDPLIRWRVLSGTEIERSIDAGKTWTKTSNLSGPIVAIIAIRAVDALNATVTTSDGRTRSTIDGGATWAPVQGNPAAPF